MSCSAARHSVHWGVGCVCGSILCRYCVRKGDLFVLSCARVLRMCFGSPSSAVLMSGAWAERTLFCVLFARCCCVMVECMVFIFSLIVSSVVSWGGVSIFVV